MAQAEVRRRKKKLTEAAPLQEVEITLPEVVVAELVNHPPEPLTPEVQLQAMTNAQLKKLLRRNNLLVSGSKDDLVARLLKHDIAPD